MNTQELTDKFHVCIQSVQNNDEYQEYDWIQYCSYVDGVYQALLTFCDKDSPELEKLYRMKEVVKSGLNYAPLTYDIID